MPNTQINDARLKALQNSKYKNWQDAYAEYSGRRGSNKERREFKRDWKSQDNVKARVGEDNYNQLRAEAEQRQFGAQGYNSGSAGEQRRFNRKFDKNVSNGNLRIRQIPQTLQIPQTSTTNGTVIYPWMWDTYKVRPRGVMFSQFFTPATIPAVQTTAVTPVTPEVPATPAVPVATPETPAAQTPVTQTPVANGTTPVVSVVETTPVVQTSAATPAVPVASAILTAQNQFDFDNFVNEQNLPGDNIISKNGHRYVRFDPKGSGDFYVGDDGNIYTAGLFGRFTGTKLTRNKDGYAQFEGGGIYSTGDDYTNNYNYLYNLINPASKQKQGGKMNKIKYFQQGGATPQQQDMQQQIIQLVQAAMQGDQQATQTIQQVMQAAEQGDQQAQQIAQMIQQVAEQMKGQATMAKWGSKLKYIKSLKYAKGGKTCLECQQGGDISTTHNNSLKNPLKKSVNKVEEKACGGKTKKLKK